MGQSPATADGTGGAITGGASGSPYSYGPASTVGMRSKLLTGTGVGSCHSSERAAHGLASAGWRANTSEYTKLVRKTSIEAPRQNADTLTQSFRNWRCGAYVGTRRGMPTMPTANSGRN